MPPRVNKKLLLIIGGVIVFVALAVVVALVIFGGDKDRFRKMAEQTDNPREKASALAMYVKENPDDLDARWKVAELAEERGDLITAYREYGSIIRKDPGHIPALLRIAYFEGLPSRRRYAAMERRATEVLQRAPDNTEAMLYLSEACLKQGGVNKLKEALTQANKVIKAEPKNVKAHLLAARAYFAQEKMVEGKDQLLEVLNYDEKNQKVWSKPERLSPIRASSPPVRPAVISTWRTSCLARKRQKPPRRNSRRPVTAPRRPLRSS